MTNASQQVNRSKAKQITRGLINPPPDQFIATPAKQRDLNRLIRLTGMLQTTLAVHKVIELFATEINGHPYFDNLVYTHAARHIEISLGTPEVHAITFDLVVANDMLGELTFSRSKRFTSRELAQLRYLLGGLVFPLRNALAYEWALQAALLDPLTGVHNRLSLDSTLIREIELARRHQTDLSMIIVDIDHFKRVNDVFGHAAGDSVLKHTASILLQTARSTDMIFRYGGEEFLLLLSNTTGKGALLLAERLRQNIATVAAYHNKISIPLTASFGVTSLQRSDTDKTLFERADQALYAAKTAGRNRVNNLNG